MAQCYTPAIQLAKVCPPLLTHVVIWLTTQEHGFEGEVMGLALMGRQEDKIDAAQ